MSYNDYPGVSDSYDDDRTIDESKLDSAIRLREMAKSEMDAIRVQNDPNEFRGVRYANPYDCTFVRGLAMDRCARDIERHTRTITALMLEIEPDDAEGFDPDSVSEAA